MKIYFCGSIRGGRDHADIYFRLIKHIQTFGQVLTEHVGCKELDEDGKVITDTNLTDKYIHDRDIKWLEESDMVVAEVTMPSLGVGYELGQAILMKKPVLCLYRDDVTGKKLSAMIEGAKDGNLFQVEHYKQLDEAEQIISNSISQFQLKLQN